MSINTPNRLNFWVPNDVKSSCVTLIQLPTSRHGCVCWKCKENYAWAHNGEFTIIKKVLIRSSSSSILLCVCFFRFVFFFFISYSLLFLFIVMFECHEVSFQIYLFTFWQIVKVIHSGDLFVIHFQMMCWVRFVSLFFPHSVSLSRCAIFILMSNHLLM